ncbi:MAG: methyltransferase domain-containing protein [Ilumatobacter sp.]|nr:methyltransferase domain-containing protein [Ilumatobacter sp.]
MHDDAERWNERYAGRVAGDPAMPKGLGGIELERGGRCLDVACGLGEQSLWAAQHGFEVIALDVSDTAITALNSAAMSAGLRDRIDSRVSDLDEGLPADLATTCSLVICQRYRDPDLYEQLVYMLEPGGVVVVTVLSQVGNAEPAGPHHARPGELVCEFREHDVTILRSVELDGEATLVARRS